MGNQVSTLTRGVINWQGSKKSTSVLEIEPATNRVLDLFIHIDFGLKMCRIRSFYFQLGIRILSYQASVTKPAQLLIESPSQNYFQRSKNCILVW